MENLSNNEYLWNGCNRRMLKRYRNSDSVNEISEVIYYLNGCVDGVVKMVNPSIDRVRCIAKDIYNCDACEIMNVNGYIVCSVLQQKSLCLKKN